MGIFLSNFLTAQLDEDQRMRCAYNIGGSESGKSAPKTYRLSSSENAFGSGTNLQNIPSGKSKSVGKSAARGSTAGIGDPYSYPNIRSMFIPDPGYTFFDGDLDRADLQVVVWEADDPMLKAALHQGVDIHLMNAYVLQNKSVPDLAELVETHPKYLDWRRPMKSLREFAKVFCHGTNYGGGARTMSSNTGWSIAEVERAQAIWFGAHPGIKRWHDRIKTQVSRSRYVENRFGYRWYIFDRIDSIIPEAIAWIPQSTVSVVINRIWERIYSTLPDVQVLLQVHDSLAGQYPRDRLDLPLRLAEASKITIPYEDPLIIPFNLKTSQVSWGDCE
jgi:DNA polymerase-1